MESKLSSHSTKTIFTIMRIIVGWHFLYEGLSKLMISGWSSYSYLMESKWLLSGFFHWIIQHPDWLRVVDLLNIWGLIIIGLLLFLGLFTRLASISGIFLLLLYYIANPPFIETSLPSQGHYFIVNLNVIEAGILLTFLILKKDTFWGLDQLFHIIFQQRKEKLFPQKEGVN
jgi:thiosulfate dehydrogenase [quinone] large subunit